MGSYRAWWLTSPSLGFGPECEDKHNTIAAGLGSIPSPNLSGWLRKKVAVTPGYCRESAVASAFKYLFLYLDSS